MRDPPTLVISALISAFPDALRTKCDGNLPLHFALKYGASLNVVQTLILASPKSLKDRDDSGKSCLEIFEAHKQKWESEVEADAIFHVLKEGVQSVILNADEMKPKVQKVQEEKTVSTPKDDEPQDDVSLDMMTAINEEGWKKAGLSIVVIGASGDLAKKKTYPSLLHLYDDSLLPEETVIWGFARSPMTHDDLRAKLKPFLEKTNCSPSVIDSFLSKCFYQQGKWYGDVDAFSDLNKQLTENEEKLSTLLEHNRLFYFAIPPNVFGETGVGIKESCMAEKGWTRIIIEKPFGRDLQSCEEILATLSKHFSEDQLFRIDHYLGKEMVQNLLVLRFGNLMFEKLWDRYASRVYLHDIYGYGSSLILLFPIGITFNVSY